MRQYQLAESVFVCLDEGQLVFLDLKRDRYFSLPAAPTAGLSQVVAGWPVGAPGGESLPSAQSRVNAPVLDLAESLRRRGLLLEFGSGPGKAATPVTIPLPVRELIPELAIGDEPPALPASARRVAVFVAAALTAKLRLKLLPFERVVAQARARKQAARTRAGRKAELDLGRARELVDLHARLRVFLFSSKEECLYDSLSLLEFLAWHGLAADWVFGVRARPFAAHCWVQSGGVVFNDTIEHVSGYRPIMVV